MTEEGQDSCSVAATAHRLPTLAAGSSGTSDDRTMPASLSQQCPVCFVTYFTISDLRNHFRQMHSDAKSVKCIQCNTQMTADFEVFLAHCKGHQCGGKAATGTCTKMRECHVCHKQVTASGYSHHLASHKMVTCPKCNLKVGQRNLRRHINYSHIKAHVYPCLDCSAVYHDASNLVSHRKRNHMGQEVRPHLCEVCGKKFITPSDLRTHVAGVHHNVKKFVCEFCGLSFKISSALMYHRRLHTGEKPHTCHVCERSFMKPNALAKHVRRVHGLEYHGKYRKRIKATSLPLKSVPGQEVSSTEVALKRKDPPSTSLPGEQREVSDTSHTKGAVQEEGNCKDVSAVYSLAEGNVVQVVNLHASQPLQNLAYFQPNIEERVISRPYEAATPLDAITYYRHDTESQYTVAGLLPSQNQPDPTPSRSYHGTAPSPKSANSH